MSNYKYYTVKDIESIGTDIQSDISTSMQGMLKQTRLIDLDEASSHLLELSEVADSATKGNKLRNLPIISNAKRWLKRYDSLESRINSISTDISKEQEKLETILSALMESKDFLYDKTRDLNLCCEELEGYISWLKENPNEDPDGIKMQAAVGRLKILSTTKVVTEQEVAKSVLVIKENKEIQQQLNEATQNLIPMFNTMLMNTLASKANTEAIKIRKAMIKTANHLVVENAKQIEQNAEELLSGRTDTLVNPQSIMEANKILQSTIKKVVEGSKVEATQNMELIESLKSSSASLNSMVGMLEMKEN